jgi:hypothetical protein
MLLLAACGKQNRVELHLQTLFEKTLAISEKNRTFAA